MIVAEIAGGVAQVHDKTVGAPEIRHDPRKRHQIVGVAADAPEPHVADQLVAHVELLHAGFDRAAVAVEQVAENGGYGYFLFRAAAGNSQPERNSRGAGFSGERGIERENRLVRRAIDCQQFVAAAQSGRERRRVVQHRRNQVPVSLPRHGNADVIERELPFDAPFGQGPLKPLIQTRGQLLPECGQCREKRQDRQYKTGRHPETVTS